MLPQKVWSHNRAMPWVVDVALGKVEIEYYIQKTAAFLCSRLRMRKNLFMVLIH